MSSILVLVLLAQYVVRTRKARSWIAARTGCHFHVPAYDTFPIRLQSVLDEQFTCEQVETLTICRRAGS